MASVLNYLNMSFDSSHNELLAAPWGKVFEGQLKNGGAPLRMNAMYKSKLDPHFVGHLPVCVCVVRVTHF